MDNNKGQTIFLSVIGIATLLVAIVGATFAWFSTTISGKGASANITTASISSLTLNGTQVEGENILPGWVSDDANFTIAGTVTGDVSIPYSCKINKTGEVTDLEFRVSADGADDSSLGSWTAIGTDTEVVTGNITASNPSDTYQIAVRFKETGEDQNTQQGKSATATVTCEITGGTTVYYNNTNPNGTTTQPN